MTPVRRITIADQHTLLKRPLPQHIWILSTVLLCSFPLFAKPSDPLVARCRAQKQQPLQAIGSCEEAFMQQAGDANAELAQEMLFRRSDAQLAIGDFDAAQTTLDRAAVLSSAKYSWKSTYRLQRRVGILDYRRGRFALALAAFRGALDLAVVNADTISQGQSWNDIGNALRSMGSYHEALEAYLASLRIKRSAGDEELGALMINLGDLYRDLDDAEAARAQYLQALEWNRSRGRALRVAHTHESLATLALDTKDYVSAREQLDLAATTFESLGARVDQMRVAARRARLELDNANLPAARNAVANGLALARTLAVPPTPDLALEAARLALRESDAPRASKLLSAALSQLAADAPERVGLLRLHAEALHRVGADGDAYAQVLLYQQADAKLRDAEHDQRLEYLRIRFDVAEKDQALAALKAQARLRALMLQQRTTQLWLVAATAVLGVMMIGFLTYRARERLRIAAARREAQLSTEAQYFRAAAAALEGDMRRVQALLDRSESALLALDSSAAIVAANREAATALGTDASALRGRRLDEFLDAESVTRLSKALGRIDEGETNIDFSLAMRSDAAHTLWKSRLIVHDDADGSNTLVQLSINGVPATEVANAKDIDAIPAPAMVAAPQRSEEHSDAAADNFRRELVELMLSAIAAWEQSTRSDVIELAEKSRIWRVAIDDGRLRVRAMERYLSLAKIPRHPRWREVLRTAYFVLAEAPLDAESRAELRRRCESVQAWVRRRAVV
jgi:two-component system, sensor histidine kinase ChiS